MNRNQHGLGYKKEIIFHIPDYSKLVQFSSIGFLDKKMKALEVNEEFKNVDDKSID